MLDLQDPQDLQDNQESLDQLDPVGPKVTLDRKVQKDILVQLD